MRTRLQQNKLTQACAYYACGSATLKTSFVADLETAEKASVWHGQKQVEHQRVARLALPANSCTSRNTLDK